MKGFKTQTELEVGSDIERIFVGCQDSIEVKLENFPKYVRRQHLKRFLAMYEIFKLVLPIKGSIVECGVFRGFSLMAWAKLSAILEPENLTRRVYGFDTFAGFPSVSDEDLTGSGVGRPGDFDTSSFDELLDLIQVHDKDRFLGHLPKIQLVKGDVTETVPVFFKENPHVMVSLLFVDLDLYEPTKMALREIVPRMPKGSVIAFDDLDNPIWPGETTALIDSGLLSKLRIRRFDWDPYIGYAVLE